MVILSVWSSYGHTFMSGSEYDSLGQGNESCLTCGATFTLMHARNVPEAARGVLAEGAYVAADGSVPAECSGDTGQVHGYPGERACMNPECDHTEGPCAHETHNCNCIQCD